MEINLKNEVFKMKAVKSNFNVKNNASAMEWLLVAVAIIVISVGALGQI